MVNGESKFELASGAPTSGDEKTDAEKRAKEREELRQQRRVVFLPKPSSEVTPEDSATFDSAIYRNAISYLNERLRTALHARDVLERHLEAEIQEHCSTKRALGELHVLHQQVTQYLGQVHASQQRVVTRNGELEKELAVLKSAMARLQRTARPARPRAK